jgi:hypothetical protein
MLIAEDLGNLAKISTTISAHPRKFTLKNEWEIRACAKIDIEILCIQWLYNGLYRTLLALKIA